MKTFKELREGSKVKLDELSKDTLKSYRDKAKSDRSNAMAQKRAAAHDAKWDQEGKNKAILQKKPNEASRLEKSRNDNLNKAKDYGMKSKKRLAGIKMANKKIGEEVESLDELSNKTLKSYQMKANRAAQDASDKHVKAWDKYEKHGEKANKAYAKRNWGKMDKHHAKMDKAMDKADKTDKLWKKRDKGARMAGKILNKRDPL